MFFVIALAIWTAMHAYVLWRFRSIPLIARHLPLWAVVVAGSLLGLSYIAARILEAVRWMRIAVFLEWLGGEWMGVLLIALTCFFLADVVTGFGFLMRERVFAIRTAALVVALILSLAASLNTLRPPAVRDYEVKIAALPPALDGAVVVAISDLHLGNMTSARWLASRVAEVEALRPDLVVIVGDLREGNSRPGMTLPALLAGLSAPLGVWAVHGNHDPQGAEADAVLEREGIRLLRDSSAEIAPGLWLAGVDTAGHQHVPGRGLVTKALANVPRGAATILLSHYPEQVDIAARGGAGLMLSGHTHDGQIWPFRYFVRIQYRYLGGRYEVGNMPLIVCRGTGTWGPRMRLFHPNEMLRIVLRSKDEGRSSKDEGRSSKDEG